MERIWSPWRSQYIEGLNNKDKDNQKSDCFICNAILQPDKDKELLVIARREHCIALLNKYPYNSGHILIAPLTHTGEFEVLNEKELSDIMKLAQEIVAIQQKTTIPHGFNIGMNMGQAAGAGLPGHLHLHVVPRWNGDSNFMAALADIKIISTSMEDTRETFANLLAK